MRVLLSPGNSKVFEGTRVHMLQSGVSGPLVHTRSASLPSAPEEAVARRKRGKPAT